MIVTVSWAFENGLVYLRVGPVIVIVSWSYPLLSIT